MQKICSNRNSVPKESIVLESFRLRLDPLSRVSHVPDSDE
jgi:hypothetical protein